MLRRLLYLLSCSALSSASAAWYEGQWTCNLDGRLTEMYWKWEEMGFSTDNGDGTTSSSEHGGWELNGRFKDVGRPWVKLTLMTEHPLRAMRLAYAPLVRGNTIYFEYGGDQTIWKLVYDPRTRKAVGNSTWRGKPYPLSCVRSVG